MKKKIGEIYNKPIVTGDKNLVTKNEIHESSLGGGNSGSSDVEYFYYRLNTESVYYEAIVEFIMVCELKEFILNIGPKIVVSRAYNAQGSASLCVWFLNKAVDKIKITNSEITNLFVQRIDNSDSIIPITTPKGSIKEKAKSLYPEADTSMIDDIFIPITEEEFYDLNN